MNAAGDYDPNPVNDWFGNANASLTPNTWGQANGSEDSWGIMFVNRIYKAADPTKVLWQSSAAEYITGLYYGVDDDNIVPTAGTYDFYGVSGHLDFYLDAAPVDFNQSLGTGGRVVADPTGKTYTTVTDGSPFLTMDFVPGVTLGNADPNDDHITFFANLSSTTSPFTGSGMAYASITGGNYGDLFDSDAYKWASHTADFELGWHVVAPSTTADWLVDTYDPFKGTAVPEPASMLLVGTGFMCLAGWGRKKFRKKD